MSQKKYPVLYVQNAKGSLYKHCSVNPTLYFKINVDDEKAKTDQNYKEYMDYIEEEIYSAITNKYILSSPTRVSNDKVPFLIFKSNIDLKNVKEFCKAMLDELEYFTKVKHNGVYAEFTTLLLQMDKTLNFFRANQVGEKLSQSTLFTETKETLNGTGAVQDNGILTPYDIYLASKNKEKNEEDSEEVVTW